jgi:hypothetical protein
MMDPPLCSEMYLATLALCRLFPRNDRGGRDAKAGLLLGDMGL